MALVQDLREGMAGVDGQRGEDGEDLVAEKLARPFRIRLAQRRDIEQVDVIAPRAAGGSRRSRASKHPRPGRARLLGWPRKRLAGVRPSGPVLDGAAVDLLLDAGHADLEKLVEVRGEDGEELDPLQQRLGGVLRLLQHAPVELEPAQLAIDEILWVRKIRPHPTSSTAWDRGAQTPDFGRPYSSGPSG